MAVFVGHGDREVVILVVGMPGDMERGPDPQRRKQRRVDLEPEQVEEAAEHMELSAGVVLDDVIGGEECKNADSGEGWFDLALR